jgi:hypothetical protein
MTAIYGLYASPDDAQRAFDKLKAAGISEHDIVIMSSEPLEEYEFGSRDRQTVMPWIAVLGAAVGLAAAYFLTSLTQQAWAINTGGMPIVTNWTNIIIVFELTMLGAVFATVLTLMRTARLPGRLPKFYDPEISRGKILVGLADADGSRSETIQGALRSSNATEVKTIQSVPTL